MTNLNDSSRDESRTLRSTDLRADAAQPGLSGSQAAALPGHEIAVAPIRLNEYWPYQVTVLADRIARLTSAIVKREAGLNLSQWRVLAAIAEAPGRTARM